MNEYLVQFGTKTKQCEDAVRAKNKISAINKILKTHKEFILEMENEDDFKMTVEIYKN